MRMTRIKALDLAIDFINSHTDLCMGENAEDSVKIYDEYQAAIEALEKMRASLKRSIR